ncbi:hypothetical protein DE146DRAFT_188180 [Phaeosphaeria sp. MPI-PUGE-AT-0046c]|nr:hypothetical protein DE146DRAFT_188180 [Phaeosphaeria sp. MPI-PUGE-AT-0046c]
MALNSTTVGWMPEPQGRGTIGLVWSCLATIFICIWSALHLHLPSRGDGALARAFEQAGYVILGLFAPEWLTYLALNDLERAMNLRRRCPTWSLKRCFFFFMGGMMIQRDNGAGAHYHCRPEPVELFELFENGTIAWPDFKDSEIDDRTQGDHIVKIIALGQLVWFIAQIVGRAVDGLAVTTLELFTLSNVLCTVITYLVWWHKPNGVRAPIVIDGVYPPEATSWSHFGLTSDLSLEQSKSLIASVLVGVGFGALHLVGWNFHFPSETERLLWRISSVGVTATSIFMPGLSALNSALKRPEDKRNTAGAILFADKIITSIFRSWILTPSSVKMIQVLSTGLLMAPLGFYSILRLYMFVEMFAGLRNTPATVYVTANWTQYLPTVG